MRGDLVNLNFRATNKQSSGLKVKCLEIPHYAYSGRCTQAKNDSAYEETINNID